jgi:maltooligosyltrehalose trehalohydrolase
MLFMGEEWGTRTPFMYFIDHGDPGLVEAVRAGRRNEFAGFIAGEVPDPADPSTRDRSVLDWSEPSDPEHAQVLALHRALVATRAEYPSVTDPSPDGHTVTQAGQAITIHNAPTAAWNAETATWVAFNLGPDDTTLRLPSGEWTRLLDTEEPQFGGAGISPDEVRADRTVTIAPWSAMVWVASPRPSGGGPR